MKLFDKLEGALEADDLARVQDSVGKLTEAVLEPAAPSIDGLWERRMCVQTLKTAVKRVLDYGGIADTEDEWRDCYSKIDKLMLENFTRQAVGDISVIPRNGVKYSHYATPTDGHERRTYMGLHSGAFDNDGLSLVVAFKPTLHEQPYHSHGLSDENSLAVHPTIGLAVPKFGSTASIHSLDPGQMVRFAKNTPHTMKNPTHQLSADASVKVPEAIGDRVKLCNTTIGQFLHEHQDDLPSSGIIDPTHASFGDGIKKFRYQITDCGKTYRIDYMVLPAGKSISHFDIDGIAKGTRALMTVFPQQNVENAHLAVGGDVMDESRIKFGEWIVLSDKFSDGISLKNPGTTESIIYMAREV